MKGGYHKRKKPRTGQQALLDALWKKCGGIATLSKRLNISRQDLINWRLRGQVPLELCNKIGSALSISVYALNFKGITRFVNNPAIDAKNNWKETVLSCGLSDTLSKYILSLPEPI